MGAVSKSKGGCILIAGTAGLADLRRHYTEYSLSDIMLIVRPG
jgi:hypothetical protein